MESRNSPNRSDPPKLLHEYFIRQADATPGDEALRSGKRTVTYAELRRSMEAVTGALAGLGVGPGAMVGLNVHRSIEWVAASLGILRSGAAVLPLPSTYPRPRLREILDHGAPDSVLVGRGGSLRQNASGPILDLEEVLADGLDQQRDPQWDPPGVPTPDHPAFVLSSSGSTGRPKLIVRSHRSFFHRLRWTWTSHPFQGGELGCQKAHMTTTHSVYELFEPLLAGAPTLIVEDRTVGRLDDFWETVAAEGVTRLLIVPSALQASLEGAGFTVPSLQVLVLMGEYVSPDLALRTVEAFSPSTRVYSIYGSTEASSALVTDLRRDVRPGRELPLGEPLVPSIRPLILDDHLRPVPRGTPGRLYMAGPHLFSGYLEDPEATSAVLLDGVPGIEGPVFDTRDRVVRTEEGLLEFLGRVDHVVKIRGFRVDLQEVERALSSHPDVGQAAVIAEGEGTAEAAIVGFYTPGNVDRDRILQFLEDRLDPQAMPSALFAEDALPLTASGKVDREALRKGLESHGGDPTEGAPLSDAETLSETESRLAAVWKRTLGHSRFTVESSFFEAGGTSLTAFALIHRIREAFDLEREELPERLLYRYSSVRSMALYLDSRDGDESVSAEASVLVTLRSGGRHDNDLEHGVGPLFLIASAGGAVGAYRKLVDALDVDREIVGVMDPFLWGDRDPTAGFRSWVDRYFEAIRGRQPHGPYHIVAFSSAGAFGFELARRLRQEEKEKAFLALIDPVAMDRGSRWRYGHWALRSIWRRSPIRAAVRLLGFLRSPLVALWTAVTRGGGEHDYAPSTEEFSRMQEAALSRPGHLSRVTALMELNSDLPLAVEEEELTALEAGDRLDAVRERFEEVGPGIDFETIRRTIVQYEHQVLAHHAYRLRRFDGRVLIVEPDTPQAGLLAALVRPFAGELIVRRLPVGEPSSRERELTSGFGRLQAHYRCMRDDTFVTALAGELEALL